MNNIIINKRENAPASLDPLLGIGFLPHEHLDIIYVPGYYNVQGVTKISYNICLLFSWFFGFLFLYTTISETVKWVKYSEFRSEGVFITFVMFSGIFMLFLICRQYFIKSKKLQKQIECGEHRLGLWITPTYIIINDLNEGFRCVEKKEITSLSIYKRGKLSLDLVILHLRNKQEMRVVANWLPSYDKKVDELKYLIESNLVI